MVDINLIPPALRENGQGNADALRINIPHQILVAVGAGVLFLMLTVHLILGVIWLVGVVRLSYYSVQWQQVLPHKSVLDGILKESGDLKTKTIMLSDMTTKKSVPWAPKFNVISDALPRGLWIRKMTLDKVGLTIEGSVVSKNQSEINNVDKLLSALRQNDNFIKGFSSLEVNSIQRAKSNAVDVTDFIVMAKLIETKTNETKPKPKSK